MKNMRSKTKLKMILLILLLLVSQNALSDQALAKRLLNGQAATYDGTLFNDEALRQIDIDLLEKDVCERKLKDCDDTDLGFSTPEFLIGVLVGGFTVWAIGH